MKFVNIKAYHWTKKDTMTLSLPVSFCLFINGHRLCRVDLSLEIISISCFQVFKDKQNQEKAIFLSTCPFVYRADNIEGNKSK